MNCPTCGSECTTPENSITNYFTPIHIDKIKVLEQQLTTCQEENKRLKQKLDDLTKDIEGSNNQMNKEGIC